MFLPTLIPTRRLGYRVVLRQDPTHRRMKWGGLDISLVQTYGRAGRLFVWLLGATRSERASGCVCVASRHTFSSCKIARRAGQLADICHRQCVSVCIHKCRRLDTLGCSIGPLTMRNRFYVKYRYVKTMKTKYISVSICHQNDTKCI